MPQRGVAAYFAVVVDHLFNGGLLPDGDHFGPGPCDRRIEEVAVAEHGRHVHHRQDDRFELGALALVDRDGIGQFEVFEVQGRVDGFAAVEVHFHDPFLLVYRGQDADISVEDSAPLLGPSGPEDVVVVFDLHDLVPFAEHAGLQFDFILALCRRVDRLLQDAVEVDRARVTLPGGAQHLDVPDRVVAVGLRQTGLVESDDVADRASGILPFHVEKVVVLRVQHRHVPRDDAVGVGDDEALHGLPEHLVELDRGQKP